MRALINWLLNNFFSSSDKYFFKVQHIFFSHLSSFSYHGPYNIHRYMQNKIDFYEEGIQCYILVLCCRKLLCFLRTYTRTAFFHCIKLIWAYRNVVMLGLISGCWSIAQRNFVKRTDKQLLDWTICLS